MPITVENLFDQIMLCLTSGGLKSKCKEAETPFSDKLQCWLQMLADIFRLLSQKDLISFTRVIHRFNSIIEGFDLIKKL